MSREGGTAASDGFKVGRGCIASELLSSRDEEVVAEEESEG